MATTYEPIATQTTASDGVTLITFSSIPTTYTDLRVVGSFSGASTGLSGSTSVVVKIGSGTYKVRATETNATTLQFVAYDSGGFDPRVKGYEVADGTGAFVFDVFNYRSTTTKAMRSQAFSVTGTGTSGQYVPTMCYSAGSLSMTSAVSSIQIQAFGSLKQNSRFTLYGITGV